MKLYELSQELAVINDDIISADGELTEALEARLDAATMAFEDKAMNIARWTLNLDGVSSAIDSEIKRLQRKKQVSENLQKRLKEYVKSAMIMADIKKLDLGVMSIRVQNNPASLEIDDEKAIPEKYKKEVTETVIEKKEILKDLKDGKEVKGARLITDKTHLRIS